MSIDFMQPFYDAHSLKDIDEFYRPCYVGRNLRFDVTIKMNKIKGLVSQLKWLVHAIAITSEN